jgi:hypothetical protein
VKNINNDPKIYVPKGRKIYVPVKRPNGHKIYHHLLLKVPPKFAQMRIFGMKKYTVWQPCLEPQNNDMILPWWRVLVVSAENGAMGREIESGSGIGWMKRIGKIK